MFSGPSAFLSFLHLGLSGIDRVTSLFKGGKGGFEVPGSFGFFQMLTDTEHKKSIEALVRGEKLVSPSAYYSLFWAQLDTLKCSECISVLHRAKQLKGKMSAIERVEAKNVERGKCLGKCCSRDKKMQWLTALASIVFDSTNFPDRQEQRRKFNNHWSIKGTSGGICFVCGGEARHRHHLIQIQHGGSNTQRNHVPLCKRCHSDVHSIASRQANLSPPLEELLSR